MPPVRVWDVGPDKLLFYCCSWSTYRSGISAFKSTTCILTAALDFQGSSHLWHLFNISWHSIPTFLQRGFINILFTEPVWVWRCAAPRLASHWVSEKAEAPTSAQEVSEFPLNFTTPRWFRIWVWIFGIASSQNLRRMFRRIGFLNWLVSQVNCIIELRIHSEP